MILVSCAHPECSALPPDARNHTPSASSFSTRYSRAPPRSTSSTSKPPSGLAPAATAPDARKRRHDRTRVAKLAGRRVCYERRRTLHSTPCSYTHTRLQSIELDDVKEKWEALGRDDPFWTVLAWEGTEHAGWNIDRFYAESERDVKRLLAEAEALQVTPRLGEVHSICRSFEISSRSPRPPAVRRDLTPSKEAAEAPDLQRHYPRTVALVSPRPVEAW